ncbi:hypothetical protein A6X21_14980 [Planctopirus hydrillae]|uniref:Uncharacterized protein n=1 Tax=Planctopirus hydrillae TaxID=1841610 RepID=A0A1C3E3X2_9PLAN|nr:hypothetical protein A6X21_14980 [Planctopirus hydrillae]
MPHPLPGDPLQNKLVLFLQERSQGITRAVSKITKQILFNSQNAGRPDLSDCRPMLIQTFARGVKFRSNPPFFRQMELSTA